MNFEKIRDIFYENDGSLPDINFDFGDVRVAGDAYVILQARATCLASKNAYYWSKSRGAEERIYLGDNPALAFLDGDADVFHVVFGGLRSTTGARIPDLGLFVLGMGFLALDYRMGPEWDEPAIVGLFEIMRDLQALTDVVTISHVGNIFERDEGILLTEFKDWLDARNSQESVSSVDCLKEGFDPQMLIEDAQAQAPQFPWLPAALNRCIDGKWESRAYVRYVSSIAANQPGSEWQFDTNIVIDHSELGMVVIDLLRGDRIGGIEFVDRIDC